MISGDAPTKESFLHLAMYRERAGAGAVVHLHSTHSVAVSCLDGINHDDVLPPITAYYVMRVGKLPLIPYFAPGDKALGEAVGQFAAKHAAVLLANHGPVVSGSSLSAAVDAIEELEETARLYLLASWKANALPERCAGGRPEAKISIGSEYSHGNAECIGGRSHRAGLHGHGHGAIPSQARDTGCGL